MNSIDTLKQAAQELHFLAGSYDSSSTRDQVRALAAALEAMAEQPPAAYIEHHKGGDNLVWDNPGGKKSALYTAPITLPAQKPVFEIGFGWLDDPEKYPRGTNLYAAPISTPKRSHWHTRDGKRCANCGNSLLSHDRQIYCPTQAAPITTPEKTLPQVALGAGQEHIRKLADELLRANPSIHDLREAARFLQDCYLASPVPEHDVQVRNAALEELARLADSEAMGSIDAYSIRALKTLGGAA